MKTYDYMLLENMHAEVCVERDHWRADFDALNEQLRTTCEELDAMRAENAELVEAMCHPTYAEENRLRAELAALREQLEYYRRYAAPKPEDAT